MARVCKFKPKNCAVCGKEFMRRTNNAKYCSEKCRHEAWKGQGRRWAAANSEKAGIYFRQWAAANREKLVEYGRQYRAANREKLLEKGRQYRAANPEKCREQARRRREMNPERDRRQSAMRIVAAALFNAARKADQEYIEKLIVEEMQRKERLTCNPD